MTDELFKYQRLAPCFRIEFRVVPSWNDILSTTDAFYIQNDIKKWRKRGRERGAEALKAAGHTLIGIRKERRSKNKDGTFKADIFEGLETPLFTEPIGCIVRLWRPTAASYDVHNLVVKPLIDGLGDIRVFETDAVRGFPELGFTFEGVDPLLKLQGKELEDRKRFIDSYKARGKNPPRMPLPSRIWFDFYRLSRLKYATLFQFEKI